MNKSYLKKLWGLFLSFFKAGTFTFAGGLAMLPVIQKDIVEKYEFMSEEDFLEYATLSQTLPGVISLNCAVFVGRRTAGTGGMIVAGIGATFSAFVLMIAATVLLEFIPQEGSVVGAFQGIRAASAAIVLSAAFAIGRHNLKNIFAVAIMVITFALALLTDISAVIIIVSAGIAGYFFQRFKKSKEIKKHSDGKGDEE